MNIDTATRDQLVAAIQHCYLRAETHSDRLVRDQARETMEMLLDRLDLNDAATVRMSLWTINSNIGMN